MSVRIVVAGTSGGVGTTTVAAILSQRLGARKLDHTGGELDARCGGGSTVGSESHQVHDLGAHADGLGMHQLSRRGAIAVVVTAATPLGVQLAGNTLRNLAAHADPGHGTILVMVEAFGRHSIAPAAQALRVQFPTTVMTLPQDRALAAGGRVPFERLSTATLRRSRELVHRVDELAAFVAI
ncbi:MAG: hypothetical protein ACRCSP_09565 [Rhodoglobus sp.]